MAQIRKELTTIEKERNIRVRRLREDLGLSQEQFAADIGMSASGYKKMEALERPVSLHTLEKIYKRMNVSTDYLLYGSLTNLEQAWQAALNCSDADKMIIYLRLFKYFVSEKKGMYPLADEMILDQGKIFGLLEDMGSMGNRNAT